MKQNNWVGVDCHKETLACYKNGNFKEFKTNQKGYESALKWAGSDAKWTIEGAYWKTIYFLPYQKRLQGL